jgi:protein-disulfide isomerase
MGRKFAMKIDVVVGTTLVVCALIVTGIVVRREVLGPAAHAVAERKTVMMAGWREYLEKGAHIGPHEAPVQLIEFADFECPFCATFHRDLKALRTLYPTQVSLTFVHFPLPTHRFAMPAARVAECAGEQGRFEAMHDQLFDEQSNFGLKPWNDYASAAGVPDLSAFDLCIKKTGPIPRVEEGKALGAKLDLQGTPTIIINGWKLGRPPTEDQLDGMVKKILAGKRPVS